MQRPISHQKKHFRRQIALYLVLLVFLVVFFATIGLKLLISASLFIANFGKPDTATEESTDQDSLIRSPKLLNIPNATNSAKLMITVQAQEDTTVSIYVNDLLQKEIVPTETTFDTQVILTEGENTIYSSVQDEKGKSEKSSKTYTVYYLSEKPKLLIDSPKDKATTTNSETEVVGRAGEQVTIRVNGQPAIVGAGGTFSKTIRLSEGENKITVTAVDQAGNSEEKNVTVIYERE